MSIEDKIRPLTHHSLGIPRQLLPGLRRMSIKVTPRHVVVALRAYERLMKLIEQGLAGVNVPADHEQDAADYVAHIIVDAAFLHNCIRASGYSLIGDFPYDHLADRIVPVKRHDGDVDKGV